MIKGSRHAYALVNLVLACGVCLIGIAIVGIGIAFRAQQKFFWSDGPLLTYSQMILTGMICIGVSAIAASIAGIALLHIRGWPVVLVYGICLTPIWIALAVFGD